MKSKEKVAPKSTALTQPTLDFRSWGGARRGAGRKKSKGRRSVPHTKRERFKSRYVEHVTLRVRVDIWSLRGDNLFYGIRERIGIAAERFGMRIIQYSVLGNHIHMLVEGENHESLARAMKGLAVRIARYINKVMRRRGPVFDGRYHVHILKTPREVRNALLYVLENRKKDILLAGKQIDLRWMDPCSSAKWFDGWVEAPKPPPLGNVTVPASRWLLTHGWKRHGLLRLGEIASVARR